MFFGLFDSQEKKTRTHAANWLELADKIYNYRRDVLSEAERTALLQAAGSLRRQLKERNDASKLKLGVEALEAVLRKTGGAHYPKSSFVENVEFFVVAAIVILGVRMYFVQPFKIPTNSMWPSYNGMTAEVFHSKAEEPGAAARVLRFATTLASANTINAPVAGEVSIPLVGDGQRVKLPYKEVSDRTWLVLPTKMKEYTLLVAREPVTIRVPLDFDFEWVVRDAFFPEMANSREPGAVDLATRLHKQTDTVGSVDGHMKLLRTGKIVRAGERVLSFDILTGDNLFVDRVSFHFMRPTVGEGFVFRTGNIPDIKSDQYYIKRLVGAPGDLLQVQNYTLLRNGQPISGAPAFNHNAKREGRYVGYRNEGVFSDGGSITVPSDGYFAMGDNSANSGDSRYWGKVPRKDVVGRPIFVYYPFTKHWGPAP